MNKKHEDILIQQNHTYFHSIRLIQQKHTYFHSIRWLGFKYLPWQTLKVFFVIWQFFITSTYKKGNHLYLNKPEFPSPKDVLCQVLLKLAQWFWRGYLKSHHCIFLLLSPLEEGHGSSFETKRSTGLKSPTSVNWNTIWWSKTKSTYTCIRLHI